MTNGGEMYADDSFNPHLLRFCCEEICRFGWLTRRKHISQAKAETKYMATLGVTAFCVHCKAVTAENRGYAALGGGSAGEMKEGSQTLLIQELESEDIFIYYTGKQ